MLIRIAVLERKPRGLPQNEISNLGDPKLHRYNTFNIELLQSEKGCIVFLKLFTSLV